MLVAVLIGAPPGLMLVTTGTGGFAIETRREFDVPPVGSLTVTVAVPVAVNKLAGTCPTR
jgi:hypothetical protein